MALRLTAPWGCAQPCCHIDRNPRGWLPSALNCNPYTCALQDKLTQFLKTCGYNPKKDIAYVPISGLYGDNILKPVDATKTWCVFQPSVNICRYTFAVNAVQRDDTQAGRRQ